MWFIVNKNDVTKCIILNFLTGFFLWPDITFDLKCRAKSISQVARKLLLLTSYYTGQAWDVLIKPVVPILVKNWLELLHQNKRKWLGQEQTTAQERVSERSVQSQRDWQSRVNWVGRLNSSSMALFNIAWCMIRHVRWYKLSYQTLLLFRIKYVSACAASGWYTALLPVTHTITAVWPGPQPQVLDMVKWMSCHKIVR